MEALHASMLQPPKLYHLPPPLQHDDQCTTLHALSERFFLKIADTHGE